MENETSNYTYTFYNSFEGEDKDGFADELTGGAETKHDAINECIAIQARAGGYGSSLEWYYEVQDELGNIVHTDTYDSTGMY